MLPILKLVNSNAWFNTKYVNMTFHKMQTFSLGGVSVEHPANLVHYQYSYGTKLVHLQTRLTN